jgi:hypothetical protein
MWDELVHHHVALVIRAAGYCPAAQIQAMSASPLRSWRQNDNAEKAPRGHARRRCS